MLEPTKSSCSIATRVKCLERSFPSWLPPLALLVLLGGAAARTHAADETSVIYFDIGSESLDEALHRFSEQAGLQIVYDGALLSGRRSVRLVGEMTVVRALDRLLRRTGLSWHFANETTVVITPPPSAARRPAEPAALTERSQSLADGTVDLSDVDVDEQRWLPAGTSDAAFGFSKSLFETPRTMSYISEETIDLFGLSAVEDLLRIVPGVFTTTRFGIQGSVDVRNVPADTYFRGMRRLTLQGHGRSVLAAMDSIEVVGGPPSPLYGLGKIGGYTNVVPKSGRAKSGRYLSETEGFIQGIGGQYDRKEVSFGFGGPLSFLKEYGRPGGYYVYGLIEDSQSYAEGVPVKQQLLQAAISIDDFAKPFRLEAGVNVQISRTAGALTGRLTQELVDNGSYIGGAPLVDLDLNGNGEIGYLEMQSASPVTGSLSSANQPLIQLFAWPTDANGDPLPLDQFPQVSGIPASMYEYLTAHPEADPTGLLRAQGVGGPTPISGAVPVGMVLDPRTVGYRSLNPRRSAAFERSLKAVFLTAYADLIYDIDPNFTVKNQLFFDSMDQFKSSNQPFSQVQHVYVIENKLTLTRRLERLSWLRINTLASFNARNTVSRGKMALGDYSNHRTDATSPTWNAETGGMTANTTFASANENSDLGRDGLPWFSLYRTEYSEIGLGVLLDIDMFRDTNLLFGGRIDGSRAENVDYAGRFNANTGTSAAPGAYLDSDDVARAWDRGTSWSFSISRQLPYGLRPYATWARSSLVLDGNNNALQNSVIRAGHIGSAELKEAGLKASWLGGRMLFTGSAFEQGRIDVSEDDDANVLSAYPTATTTRGWQMELKWVPTRDLMLSLYAIEQTTEYTPNVGGQIQVDARALGFKDVVDAAGNVIYPAEAFLYGGRARIQLPNNMEEYKYKQGNPPQQVGLSAVYQLAKNLGVTFKGGYLSSTCSGRLCLVRLPQSHVYDAGVFWETRGLHLKFDVFNLTDEHYYRARTGDTLGDVIAQAMPGRRWQFTARYEF